jgi:multidrug efflux pump subunit AcrA (membrane-fusion protein)
MSEGQERIASFTSRMGIGILVGVMVGLGAGAIVAERHLAASPAPAKSMEVDSRPRVEIVHPRRRTVAQRLQTNATLAAFEADLFAKVSGYLSDVRVDIGDHVKAGQVLAVIEIPEMEQELAEDQAQLASKESWRPRAARWTTSRRTSHFRTSR